MGSIPGGGGWRTSDCKPAQMAPLDDVEPELHSCDRGLAYSLGPRTRLYRFHHVVALVSASLTLLVLFPLFWAFGPPWLAASNRWVGFGGFRGENLGRQDQFLIGVGKADITGYGSRFLRWFEAVLTFRRLVPLST